MEEIGEIYILGLDRTVGCCQSRGVATASLGFLSSSLAVRTGIGLGVLPLDQG